MLCTATQCGDLGLLATTVEIMNQSRELSPALLQQAELQSGIFTKSQVNHSDTREVALARAISDGRCHRVQPGLYSLRPLLTSRASLWAGLLLGGPEARLGGDAARLALGKGQPPEIVDVWTGSSSRRDRGSWKFHPGYPPPDPSDETNEPDAVVGTLLMTPNLEPALLSQQAERQLDIRTRQLILDLSRQPCDDGSSVLESVWRSHVQGPHELPPISWTHSTGSGVRILGSLDAAHVRIALQPCHPALRCGSTWQRWQMNVPDPPTCTRLGDQITVSLHWADVVKRPCKVAEEVSRALAEAGSPHIPLSCPHCPRIAQQSPWADGSSLDSCPTCGSRPAHLWTPQRFSSLASLPERSRAASRAHAQDG